MASRMGFLKKWVGEVVGRQAGLLSTINSDEHSAQRMYYALPGREV